MTKYAEIRCRIPDCEGVGIATDRYCPLCGASFSKVSWRGEDGPWEDRSGRLSFTPSSTEVVVVFSNAGAGPLALWADEDHFLHAPDWIEKEGNRYRTPFLVEPQTETRFVISLDQGRLRSLVDNRASAGQDCIQPAKFVFYTSLVEEHDGRFEPLRLEITLVLAFEPWASPTNSFFPFLPRELLQGDGLLHSVQLRNDTAESIVIKDILFEDALADAPPGYVRLPLKKLFGEDRATGQTVLDREQGIFRDFPLRLDAVPQPAERPAWFSGAIVFNILRRDTPDAMALTPVRSTLSGRVGAAPTVVIKGHPSRNLAFTTTSLVKMNRIPLVLENPGHIPVRVRGMEILLANGMAPPHPERDWLRFAEEAREELVLGPSQTATVNFICNGELREGVERTMEWCERVLRIAHDGWGGSELHVQLAFQLGKFEDVRSLSLGIDFGTSNSMVALVRQQHHRQCDLEPGANDPTQLASSIFYQYRSGEAYDFLFGQEAKETAAIQPVNLVSQIKTVLTEKPESTFHFVHQSKTVKKTAQELMDIFIQALRQRAENAVATWDADWLKHFGMGARQVRFRRAVFTHPVEFPDSLRSALLEAANTADLNKGNGPLDAYLIDEPTAAVLAFLHDRLAGLTVLSEPSDKERIMCVDVGGGTTDVTAIEAGNQGQFLRDADVKVTLKLLYSCGKRFGGNDIDCGIGESLLQQLQQHADEQGDDWLDIALVRQAMRCLNYKEFLETYLVHRQRQRSAGLHGQAEPPAHADLEIEARMIYALAKKLLDHAEKSKMGLKPANPFTQKDEWPSRQAPGLRAYNKEFSLDVAPQAVADITRKAVDTIFTCMDETRKNAAWQWSDVDTLLLIGQGMLLTPLTDGVLEKVLAARGDAASEPLVIRPDDATPFYLPPGSGKFNPKACVAYGAAIWGDNSATQWLEIENRMRKEVMFDIQRQWGPKFQTVIPKGTPLPVRQQLDFPIEQQALTLYRNKNAYLEFSFPPAKSVILELSGSEEATLVVGDDKFPGKTA